MFPGTEMSEYLNFASHSDINEESLPYQPVEVETNGTSLRGGEFIYSFLRRVFID